MLEQQIIVLMDATGLRVLDRHDSGIGLLVFDCLEDQVERFARQQFDGVTKEAACSDFAVSSPLALKSNTERVLFRHVGGWNGCSPSQEGACSDYPSLGIGFVSDSAHV